MNGKFFILLLCISEDVNETHSVFLSGDKREKMKWEEKEEEERKEKENKI